MRKDAARVFALLALVFALLAVFVPVAKATDTVPLNGSFVGLGDWGWWTGSAYDTGNTAPGDGGGSCKTYDQSGALQNQCWSKPFNVSASSHLYFQGKVATGGDPIRVKVADYINGAAETNPCTYSATTSWASYDCNLSAYAGHDILVRFDDYNWGSGHYAWFDAVSASYASNYYNRSEGNQNGSFYSGLWGWASVFGGYNAAWDGATGHNGNGALKNAGYGGFRVTSRPVTISSASWGLWAKSSSSDNTIGVKWLPMDGSGGAVDLVGGTGLTDNDSITWDHFTWSMSAYVGQTGVFIITNGAVWGTLWVDDICPSGGCFEGTPTPTPTLTPTPVTPGVYGQNTPLPFDWSKYPTPAPYPSFPPFPTAIYSAGTAQPVTINGGSPIPVYLVTPLATQLPYSTAIYGKDTPMPYLNVATATPSFTPLPLAATSGGSMSGATTVPNQPNFANPQSNSNLAFGSGSDTSSPVDIVIVQTDLVYNFSFLYPILPNSTWIIHYIYPSHFKFAGIDLMTGILGIGAVWFAVFLIRRLQKR